MGKTLLLEKGRALMEKLVLVSFAVFTLVVAACADDDDAGTTPTGSNRLQFESPKTTCSQDAACPPGTQCTDFSAIDPAQTELVCAGSNPCDWVVCESGKRCVVLESIPGKVKCDI